MASADSVAASPPASSLDPRSPGSSPGATHHEKGRPPNPAATLLAVSATSLVWSRAAQTILNVSTSNPASATTRSDPTCTRASGLRLEAKLA